MICKSDPQEARIFRFPGSYSARFRRTPGLKTPFARPLSCSGPDRPLKMSHATDDLCAGEFQIRLLCKIRHPDLYRILFSRICFIADLERVASLIQKTKEKASKLLAQLAEKKANEKDLVLQKLEDVAARQGEFDVELRVLAIEIEQLKSSFQEYKKHLDDIALLKLSNKKLSGKVEEIDSKMKWLEKILSLQNFCIGRLLANLDEKAQTIVPMKQLLKDTEQRRKDIGKQFQKSRKSVEHKLGSLDELSSCYKSALNQTIKVLEIESRLKVKASCSCKAKSGEGDSDTEDSHELDVSESFI